mmetsp:Transcript_109662/g.333413  ORF Transcript_109662/g.333413 Transcript_109662/m.333413 type:complete len:785 (-) Transcript_109662:59-2413(-)
MEACQIAAAAAAAASEGGTAKAAYVMKELAKLTLQLSYEQLQVAAAQITLEGLRLCEQYAQRSVQLLVEALRTPQNRPELAADAAWMLHKLTQRCDVTRQWTLDAGGLAVVRQALAAHPTHNDLVQCSVGIVHSLEGLQGLASLLSSGAGGEGAQLPDSVLAAVVWSVHDLMKQERGSAELALLLRLVVQLLAQRSHDLEVRSACCAALDAMVHEDPRLGGLLIDLGGAPLLLETLRHARELGSSGAELVQACVGALASLAGGSAMQAEALRQHGAVQALAQCGVRGEGGKDEEAAVWAVGHLAGIGTVLQCMSQSSASQAAIRGGLDAVTELACQAAAPSELACLPGALQALLALLQQVTAPASHMRCRKKCIAAICSTVIGMAPHAEPGQLPELDRAVTALLEVLRVEPSEETSSAALAGEALGRLALVAPAWREGLKQCGAVGVLAARINGGHGSRDLSNYCFWATAALLGLPFVVHELRVHLQSADVVSVALYTVADILDDDLESEYAHQAAECSEVAVPSLLALMAEAMQAHSGNSDVQRHGCQCVGLLVASVSPAAMPPEAVSAVLTAARRHPCCVEVVRHACGTFRSLLCHHGGGKAAGEEREATVSLLQWEGADVIAERAIADFARAGDSALLEDAVAVLAALSGVRAVLDVLKGAGPGQVRSAGVKALFEFGCQQPAALCRVGEDAADAMEAMMTEASEDESLQQSVALLMGLCGSCDGRAGHRPRAEGGRGELQAPGCPAAPRLCAQRQPVRGAVAERRCRPLPRACWQSARAE